GSQRGRQRSLCRSCQTYFRETQRTPMDALKTPAAEVAQALVIVMRRGSLRAAEEITGHTYETISVWHVSGSGPCRGPDAGVSQRPAPGARVEIDEFWSFVQEKRAQDQGRTKESAGAAWSRTGTAASSSPAPPLR